MYALFRVCPACVAWLHCALHNRARHAMPCWASKEGGCTLGKLNLHRAEAWPWHKLRQAEPTPR